MTKRFPILLVLFCVVLTSCAWSPEPPAADSGYRIIEPGSPTERAQAIQQLMIDAFLPERAAECVVDSIFFDEGVYDVDSAPSPASVNQPALIDACTEMVGSGRIELTADMLPVLNPGGMSTGSITLDGTTIDYVTITPVDFQIDDVAPVFLALPPGAQDLAITQDVALAVYQQQAVARGWVVVSPAAPGGRWFDEANASAAQAFTGWVADWVTIEGGKPHLGGMSNGGLSAFSLAALNPDGYRSLLAYPGFPQDRDRAVLDELDIPVRLWVGGQDTSWVDAMESATEHLRGRGADVELTVLPGEPHIIQSIANGILIFDELDAAR